MENQPSLGTRLLAYALSVSLALPLPLHAATVAISDQPVTQPASSSLTPNIMLILDDSGSMGRQFTPDIVSTNANTGTQKRCFDSADGDGAIAKPQTISTLEECWAGDPPAMSPDFNVQYYSPEIMYLPAKNHDGTDRNIMTAANTSNWTAVPTDAVSPASVDQFRKNLTDGNAPGQQTVAWNNGSAGSGGITQIDTMDITTQWPERVWCIDKGDSPADTTRCKVNTAYSFPDFKYLYNTDLAGDFKYRFSAPYYYRITPTEFCTDDRLNDCIAVTTATVQGGKNYNLPAPVRYCVSVAGSTNVTDNLKDCYAKKGSYKLPPVDTNGTPTAATATTRSFDYPKFVGGVTGTTTLTAGAKAIAYINVNAAQADDKAATITSIKITKPAPDGTFGAGSTVYEMSNSNGNGNLTLSTLGATKNPVNNSPTWASQIASRINSNNGSDAVAYPFTAIATTGSSPAVASNQVTITAQDAGLDMNGAKVEVFTSISGSTGATATITFTGTAKKSSCTAIGQGCGDVAAFAVSGSVGTSPSLPAAGVFCNVSNCNSSSSNSASPAVANVNIGMATVFYNALILPTGWSKAIGGSTTNTANVVTITAPGGSGVTTPANAIGSAWNNQTVSLGTTLTSATVSNSSKLQGGTITGDALLSPVNFTNGTDPTPPASALRVNVGQFTKTYIVSGTTYPFYPARLDCVTTAGVCTYDEEMTNFSNWFSYYRTRMHMAKTAIGRAVALAGLSANFRVGFMTINYSGGSGGSYLAVAPFVAGATAQRGNWYAKLYGATGTGGTPLIGALSNAGKYFAGVGPGSFGASPINSACQPNYVILTTDGYWSETDGGTTNTGSSQPARKPDNTIIGNVDGDTANNTLADVAYYYYNNDLNSTFKNQVPPSGIDTAPHQHITLYTVGMGVSGTLLFDPNYLEPGNSLDYDAIVAGTLQWPVPSANQETTVDDLWHAAVNGKGKFFSAKDPVSLAQGINEVLSSVAKRVGAGAAAATSNLQPVAGDNFAFTAQYQTVDWTGDVTARTISLTSGVISQRILWSAQKQLDFRLNTDRNIYTFDPTDTDTTVYVPFGTSGLTRQQNANKLRSFCRNQQNLSSNAACKDGGMLTTQEQTDWFDPLAGLSGMINQAAGWSSSDPRKSSGTWSSPSSMIRYLRGEINNEMTVSGTSVTDLYRNRVHLLGDVVNAQPAYVKGSPFSYSTATDPFYTDFKNSTNGTAGTRKGTVYVAANDGMLHALETDPDNVPYYQSAGITAVIPDDPTKNKFVGTLNTDPITGEGAERWAYVPTLVFPVMKFLASDVYSNNHLFSVDGSPSIGDICVGHNNTTQCAAMNKWRTILVAGLNKGGRGYYALDITDPDNPKGLWELLGGDLAKSGGATKCLTDTEANSGSWSMDCNLGYSFGNPVIAKRAEDGKWVVFVTSGYNNVNPGTGIGYLYMIDAATGAILKRMKTGVGCALSPPAAGDPVCSSPAEDTPSNLGRINAWVDNAVVDNTAKQVYAGDLKGNVWRFQLDDTVAVPRYSVTKLATLKDGFSTVSAQPVQARPELAQVGINHVVYIGTGQFLADADKPTIKRQSIYAIKDTLTGSGLVTPQVDMTRSGVDPQIGAPPNYISTITGFKRQRLVDDAGGATRSVASPAATVDFNTDKGWFIDMPDGADTATSEESAERVNVDPIIQLGTLVVPSNVPSTETCVAGGSGWVNFLDIKSGAIVPGTAAGTPASVKVAGSLIVGINIVKIGDQLKTIVTTADNQQLTKDTPTTPQGVQGRRVSWRELIVE